MDRPHLERNARLHAVPEAAWVTCATGLRKLHAMTVRNQESWNHLEENKLRAMAAFYGVEVEWRPQSHGLAAWVIKFDGEEYSSGAFPDDPVCREYAAFSTTTTELIELIVHGKPEPDLTRSSAMMSGMEQSYERWRKDHPELAR